MKRIQLYIMALCMAIPFMSSCDRNGVDDVDFEVRVKNGADIRVGEEVVFLFDGNVDYISFFSGESGAVYGEAGANGSVIKNIQNYLNTYEYTV